MCCNRITSVTSIKKLQEVQICSTLDAISAKWDLNHWTADQVVKFNSLGENNKVASFFQLKSSIRTCLELTRVESWRRILWLVGLDIQRVGGKRRYS